MAELEELYQNEFEWCQRRLKALEKIEDRFKEMRELAAYAAGRVLSQEEAAQVQEWIDALKAETEKMDKETAGECAACDGSFL